MENKKKKIKKYLLLLLLLICFVGLFAYFFKQRQDNTLYNVADTGVKTDESEETVNLNDYNYVTLEVNPRLLRLYYDSDFNVVGHFFVNTNAKDSFENTTIDNKNLQDVVHDLIDFSYNHDYLNDDNYSTTLTIDFYNDDLFNYLDMVCKDYIEKAINRKAEIVFTYINDKNEVASEVYRTFDPNNLIKKKHDRMVEQDSVVEYVTHSSSSSSSSSSSQKEEKPPIGIIEVPPAAKDLTYNGELQDLIDISSVSSSTGTVCYALAASLDDLPALDTFTEVSPQGLDANDYYVWYYSKSFDDTKFPDTEPVCLIVTIKPLSPTITTHPEAIDFTCDGNVHDLITPGSAENGVMKYRIGDGEFSETIPQGKEAGEYLIEYKVFGNKNYADTESYYILVIFSKVKCEVAPPNTFSIVYDGSEHVLITPGSVINDPLGVVYYSFADVTAGSKSDFIYTNDNLPKATDAGYYEIEYYGSPSDPNLFDNSETFPIITSISPRSIYFEVDDAFMFYGSSSCDFGYRINNMMSESFVGSDHLTGTPIYKVFDGSTDVTDNLSSLLPGRYTIKLSGFDEMRNYDFYFDDGELIVEKNMTNITGPVITTKEPKTTYVPSFEYNINYELDGGINNEDNPTLFNILSDEFALLDPIKEGYEFIGWFNSNDEQITVLDSSIKEDITLFARWSPITYYLTYYLNKEDIDAYDKIEFNIESDEITLIIPELEGYEFVGWFDKDDNEYKSISSSTIGDITLYAKFNEIILSESDDENNEYKEDTLPSDSEVCENSPDL